MKLIYKCMYDGKQCIKEIPKLDASGNVIEPEKLQNSVISDTAAWNTCIKCERNHTASGACHGRLEIED